MADSLPDSVQHAPTPSAPGAVAVPLSIAISLASAFFAAGGAYFTVTRTAAEVESLRARVDDHVRAPTHAITAERLNQMDVRMSAVEKMLAEQRSTHDDIVRISANVRALCQASRAANCAP